MYLAEIKNTLRGVFCLCAMTLIWTLPFALLALATEDALPLTAKAFLALGAASSALGALASNRLLADVLLDTKRR